MSYSSEVLADSPLGYWRLGEASGSTMTDSSGNGRNGTYTSVTLGSTSLLAGDADTAATFNGTSSRALVTHGSWMNNNSISIDMLVKPSSLTAYHVMFARDDSTTRGMMFRISNAQKLQLEVRNTGGSLGTVTGSTTLSAGTTYHVAAVVSASGTAKIYVNGVEDGSVSFSGNVFSNTLPINLGDYNASLHRYAGVIDEVAYYGTALSAARIAAHAAAATAPPSISGTFAATVPSTEASFTGSYTPADETGTFDVDLPVPVAAFTGTYQAPPTGSFAVDLPVPVASFTGDYDGTLAGTFDAVLPVATAEFTGAYTPPAISGSFAVDLPLPVAEFTGDVADALGSFAVSLPVPTVVFEGTYGGPYPTDTSNLFNGLNMVCIGTVTLTRAAVVPPTAPPKYDKALPYPEPVMAEGRPT